MTAFNIIVSLLNNVLGGIISVYIVRLFENKCKNNRQEFK